MTDIKFKFTLPPHDPSWDKGWPKMVTGICKSCDKEGEEFQLTDFGYIICGDCKIKLGKKMFEGEPSDRP